MGDTPLPHIYDCNYLALLLKKGKDHLGRAEIRFLTSHSPVTLPKRSQTYQPLRRQSKILTAIGQKFPRYRAFLFSGFCPSLSTCPARRCNRHCGHGGAVSS